MNSLNAVSPIDGRYRTKCEPLAAYFSEGALIKYRVRVEVEYFIALSERLATLRPELAVVAGRAEELRDIYRHFSDDDALAIKEIEKTTNHDVKAVEYFLKGRFDAMGLAGLKEFIHFGLTSQDINNTSVPLSMKDCAAEVLLPAYRRVLGMLDERAAEWKDIPMSLPRRRRWARSGVCSPTVCGGRSRSWSGYPSLPNSAERRATTTRIWRPSRMWTGAASATTL